MAEVRFDLACPFQRSQERGLRAVDRPFATGSYARFINPTEHETDPELSAALERLRIIEATVAYPMLLRVFDAVDQGHLHRSQLLELLGVLESFLIRRSVCGFPSNQLRKILPPVFDAAGGAGANFMSGVREQLGGKRCPDDKTFADALLVTPLYATAKRNTRLRLMLARIEQWFGHKEPADLADAQIEHILPQTLTPEWEAELGEEARDHWARLLHTIGNLTLTGYNADLSNKPYSEKRELLRQSHLEMNRYFERIERWTPHAIEERGRTLAQIAIQIWPDVGRSGLAASEGTAAARPPVAVRFRSETQPVSSWKEGAVKLLEFFEADQPGLLASIVKQGRFPADLSAEPDRFVRSKTQIGGVCFNTHASAQSLRAKVRKIGAFGGIRETDYDFILPNDAQGTTV